MQKILVVDDEKPLLQIFKSLLARENYQVVAAQYYDSALQFLKEYEFDLVITDIILGKYTGVDLLQKVKSIYPHIPVILITGQPSVETAAESVRLGAFDYLIKPVQRNDLVRVVRKALEFKALSDSKRRLEEENEQYRHHLEELVRERTVELENTYEALRKAHDELELHIEERTAELRDANEQLRKEIKERAHVEENLKRSEERFRQMAQAINQVFWLFDSREKKIVYVSPAYERIWGRQCRKLYDDLDTWFKSVHQEDRQNVFQHIYGQVAQNEELQYRIIRSDGETRWIKSRIFPVHDQLGQTTHFAGIAEDMTEKKTLEAEAIRSSHLASIGELAAGVAHEINNPINGIINYAQILIDQTDEGDEEAEIPGRIQKEGERVAKIVGNLLSFARETESRGGPASIRDIISDSLELVGKQIIKDGIQLKIDISDDLPRINVNFQKIQQVFINILSNARYALNKKYSAFHEQKILEITSRVISIDVQQYVRTIFYDQGEGMLSDLVNRVCDPFFTTKPRGEGTGLGLSISYGIVKNHGGQLFFDSLEGQYTKVIVDLPVDDI